MFVLYYSESDYDYHQLEILKVSQDKTKLEEIKSKLESEAKEVRDAYKKHSEKQKRFYREKRNEVADWFEQNMDAILEYPRGYKYGKWQNKTDWSFSVRGLKHEERDYPDWHTSKTTPYHPDVVTEHKKKFIKEVRDRESYLPWDKEVYVDHSKVKTPFPAAERFSEPEPTIKLGKIYDEGTMFIDEIEEV